jgi:hypothetical protein
MVMTTEQLDDATILQDAQRRLEQNRLELERERQRDLEKRIARADRMAERSPLAGIAAAIGRGVVAGLAGIVHRRQAPLEPLRVERERELLERIPARFRDHSLEQPSPFIPAEAVRAAQAWLDGKGHQITIGARAETRNGAQNPTAAGKTTLAGMIARSAAIRGIRVTWIDMADLDAHDDPKKAHETYERILAGDFVILDGWGKELAGASIGSDLHERKKAKSTKLPNKIHTCRPGQRFVNTLDLTGDQGLASYGSAEFRRIASERNAVCIILTRKDALDVARF